MTRYTLSHVDVSSLAQGRQYKSGATARKQRIQRIREQHGPLLIEEYESAFASALDTRPIDQDQGISPSEVALEIELWPRTAPANLSRKTEKTRQGAVRVDANGAQRVALIVPDEKREVLARLLDEYAHGELRGKEGKEKRPPNEGRVAEIDHIRRGTFETFWRDDPDAIPLNPQTELWWALWCFKDRAEKVIDTARKIGCRVAEPDTYLNFPDTLIVPVYGPKFSIEILLFGTLGIAELRRASDSPTFFMNEIVGDEREWIDDLAERVIWPPNDTPTVCLFDTGVNRAHPLLEPAISPNDLDAVESDWGVADDRGHGTGLAGLALHGDLTAALGDQGRRELTHRAESVKILPPTGFDPNEPNSYGSITHAAVSIAEFNNQNAPFRAFCLAVTNEDRTGADVTAWSAAIDQSAAGAMIGDEEGAPRRLFVVSAGNIQDNMALDGLRDPDAFPAEDPSQAWNAISVGGYTDKTQIRDVGYETFTTCAGPGELSPYSRTSYLWRERKSPFKPDIVFEAGNRALSQHGTEAVAGLPSLSLLTTGADVARFPFELFWATSAATAQAARMAAQIAASDPDYWPETVRALMVHSAQWTEPMVAEFDEAQNASVKAELVRKFGYGVPNLERAIASAQNHLAIISQQNIQPFRLDGSNVKFNEAHIYPLPWPVDVLEALGEQTVRLKVTLSYFIEPNPSFSSAIDPARYQSCGLRFDLKRSGETKAQFLKRRNRAELDGGEKAPRTVADKGWLLGEKKIAAGSLHCDIWEGTGAELAARNMLWVYPVSGWWRERKALGRYDDQCRYAIVLTLETDDQDVDLHTPIAAMVDTLIDVPIH